MNLFFSLACKVKYNVIQCMGCTSYNTVGGWNLGKHKTPYPRGSLNGDSSRRSPSVLLLDHFIHGNWGEFDKPYENEMSYHTFCFASCQDASTSANGFITEINKKYHSELYKFIFLVSPHRVSDLVLGILFFFFVFLTNAFIQQSNNRPSMQPSPYPE